MGSLSKADFMASHNIFIQNNISLKKHNILPVWVNWVQVGLSTPAQRVQIVANIRFLTHNKFLTGGSIEKVNKRTIFNPWPFLFIAELRTKLKGTDLFPSRPSVYMADLAIDVWGFDPRPCRHPFFWKAESSEYPPDINSRQFTPEEIMDTVIIEIIERKTESAKTEEVKT